VSSLSLASIKDYIVKKKEAKAGEPLMDKTRIWHD